MPKKLNIVNDRTLEDVKYAQKNQSNVTDNKGALNFNDLNRIRLNYEITEKDLSNEYYFSHLKYKSPKTWVETDVPWQYEIDRIRNNYNTINKSFLGDYFTPLKNINTVDFEEVNTWETLPQFALDMLDKSREQFLECGTVYCEEDMN